MDDHQLIQAHADYLRGSGYSPKTIQARVELVTRLARDLPHGLEASSGELAAWLGRYDGWTIYTFWVHVDQFYRWDQARREPEFDYNPMDELVHPGTPDHEPNPVSEEDTAVALDRLAGPWRMGVLLAVGDGLRRAEICNLNREDITERHIRVLRKGGRRAGAKIQQLPTHPDVWRAVAGLPPGPVVRTNSGRRFRPVNYGVQAARRLAAIGLPGVTLHRFRASFATRLAEDGVPATVIQQLMGHRQLNTTQRYIGAVEAQRRLAINSLRLPATTQQVAA